MRFGGNLYFWQISPNTARRSRQYPAKTIIHVEYADDLAQLANKSAQAKYQLHRLEQAKEGIYLFVNANKTEFMDSKWERSIFTLNGRLLKSVDQFMHIGSNISSTESDVDKCVVNAWNAIDRLSII